MNMTLNRDLINTKTNKIKLTFRSLKKRKKQVICFIYFGEILCFLCKLIKNFVVKLNIKGEQHAKQESLNDHLVCR